MPNLAQTARSLADAFETATRDNGEEFQRLQDSAPEWMAEAVRAAHDGGTLMPNDWSYRLTSAMADHIAEALEYDASRDLADIVDEGSDQRVPAYNGERLEWLASHLERAGRVDECVAEYGWPSDGGIFQAIAYGIAAELHMIGSALVAAIQQQVDESEF